jgi:hypothetical protein
MPDVNRPRLRELLVDPRESMSVEIKNWLDLINDVGDKANFAKAAMALANQGGGIIIIGFQEHEGSAREAEDRPISLNSYNQDIVNGIIHSYADPPFHCAVHFEPNPAGALFPMVVVPGGHRVPIRARRDGPNSRSLGQNLIYVRKPGPKSEVPASAQEWDDLFSRCFANRRDEIFDQIRTFINGGVQPTQGSTEPEALEIWIEESLRRWNSLHERLPKDDPARCPHGYHWFAYELVGNIRKLGGRAFSETIRNAVVRHSGWPPFWYPTRSGIEPYPYEG